MVKKLIIGLVVVIGWLWFWHGHYASDSGQKEMISIEALHQDSHQEIQEKTVVDTVEKLSSSDMVFADQTVVDDEGDCCDEERIQIGQEIAVVETVVQHLSEDELWDNDGDVEAVRKNLEGFRLVIKTELLNIDVPIVDGVSLENLEHGIGHHVTTAYPNTKSGNVALSGHRWYPGDNPYFQSLIDLDQLNEGDEIRIFYNEKEYLYKVRSQRIVSPTDTSILAQTENPQLTLYTCTPKYTAKDRLVFVADLVEVMSNK